MTILPQGRCFAVTTAAWVAAWALMASPTGAQSPEPSAPGGAAKPRATDGWRQKARQDAPAAAGATSETDAAAAKRAPNPALPKADGAKEAASSPATKRADPETKSADPAERRAVTAGSGDRSLAAEKAAIDSVTTKTSINEILARTLPLRSDRPGDWLAGAEPLHACGEPRWIEPCIPLPPCHPSHPPHPYDLVGVAGDPTCGPIYRGPCCPRTGTHEDGPLPRLHWVNDRLFDAFYRAK